MKTRLVILTLLVALASAIALPAVLAQEAKPAHPDQAQGPKQDKNPFADIPVTGTAANGAPVTGVITVLGFKVSPADPRQLLVNASFTGDWGGQKAKDLFIPDWPATLTAAPAVGAASSDLGAMAACPVLNLVLGPLHLNLLGLEVDLNQVILNVVAQSGAGSLLGNLLCAVAGLLNGFDILGNLQKVVDLLNAILALAH